MPPLAITSHAVDNAVVLTVSGEIDLSNSQVVYGALSKALARGIPVILDLTAVEFLDSRGLASILQARHEAHAAVVGETPALLTIPSPPAARVFDVAGTSGLLPLFRDLAEALAAVPAAAPPTEP